MKNQPNTKVIPLSEYNDFAIYHRKLIHDKRLTNEEKGVLTQLLDTKNFYTSIRATAKMLNISEKHFKKMLDNFKALGYLEITKLGKNYLYTFKHESKYITEFKPHLIATYTTSQLNALLNNDTTPTKYKNLIKKYFNASLKDMETFENVLNEIKTYEMPKDILKNQLEKEKQEQNEIDILNYLCGK